jgi:hypothetical protein
MRSTSRDPGNYPQHGHGRDWYARVDEPPRLTTAGMSRKTVRR